jgi:hypothetical protein
MSAKQRSVGIVQLESATRSRGFRDARRLRGGTQERTGIDAGADQGSATSLEKGSA